VPCPICDYYGSLWKQADRLEKQGKTTEADALKEEARLIKPVERYYYNAICRTITDENGNVERNVGPLILSVGVILHKKIIEAILGGENVTRRGNITDVARGYDLLIRKQLRGGFATYDSSEFDLEPSPLGTKEEIERWRKNLHDLSKLRSPKTVDELEKEIAIYKNIIPDVDDFDLDAIRKKFEPEATSPEGESPIENAPDVAHNEHDNGVADETDNSVSDQEDFAEMADTDFVDSLPERLDAE
jgi:hypothetical protein